MTKANTFIILLVIFAIYLIGAFTIDLMDNDATQYYTIAMNMYESGNYMDVTWRPDYNYLDKPPLLFWLSGFFFSIFGLNHFAYRLPSILITLLGIYSTYRFGKRLYNEKTGLYAALIYAANFAIIVINHDVRTDTMLTGFVIFSIWQLYEYLQSKKKLSFVLGFIGIGLAISTKGPLGLLIPALAIGPHLIYQRRWKDIFRPEWLLGLVIVVIVLIPMIASVYKQHGMHGINFHFWHQSFGRITGDTKWEDTTGPFFFAHSFLWSFLPWTILALLAYTKKWIGAFRAFGKDNNYEIITLSGITLVFIAMSMAQYKLPHYTYVVFPLIAIITGDYIDKTFKQEKWEGFGISLSISQTALNIILWIAVPVSFYLFSEVSIWLYILEFIFFAGFVYLIFRGKSEVPKIFSTSLITIIAIGFVLNLHFYPSLNPYQGRAIIGRDLKQMKIPPENILIYKAHKPTLDVYSGMIIPRTMNLSRVDSVLQQKQSLNIITNDLGLDSLRQQDYQIDQIKLYKDYQISILSGPFLNPETRENTLSDLFLLKVEIKK